EWNPGPMPQESREGWRSEAERKRALPPEVVARNDGDFDAAWKSAKQRVEASYELPFLAHATMEPQGALLRLGADSAELVASMQSPGGASRTIAALTGLPRSKIAISLTRAGGG